MILSRDGSPYLSVLSGFGFWSMSIGQPSKDIDAWHPGGRHMHLTWTSALSVNDILRNGGMA
jgi:hypothetical protein